MAALPEKVKTYIVERIAVFDTPSAICVGVKEEFGLELNRQHVWTYDPTKSANATRVSSRLRAIFTATRTTFLEKTGDIAIANKAVRLHRLDRMAVKAEEKGNFVLTAMLMEQAAKECGGAFTNRHELTGANGRPLVPVTEAPLLSDEEKRKRVHDALAIARQRKSAKAVIAEVVSGVPTP